MALSTERPLQPLNVVLRCLGGACLTMGALYLAWAVLPWHTLGIWCDRAMETVDHALAWVFFPVFHAIGWFFGHLWAAVVWTVDVSFGLAARYPLPFAAIGGVVLLTLVCVVSNLDKMALSEDQKTGWHRRLALSLLGTMLFCLINGMTAMFTLSIVNWQGLHHQNFLAQVNEMDQADSATDFSAQVAAANHELDKYGHSYNGRWESDPIDHVVVVDATQRTAAFEVTMNLAMCRDLALHPDADWAPVTINDRPVSTPASITVACNQVIPSNTVVVHNRQNRWPAPKAE